MAWPIPASFLLVDGVGGRSLDRGVAVSETEGDLDGEGGGKARDGSRAMGLIDLLGVVVEVDPESV